MPPSGPAPEAFPRAKGLGPLGHRAWGTRPQVKKKFLALPCVLCRSLAFCTGVLSSVQFRTLLCSSTVVCAVRKSSVQFQSLLCSSKVFCAGVKCSVQVNFLVIIKQGLSRVLPPAGQSFEKWHLLEDDDYPFFFDVKVMI